MHQLVLREPIDMKKPDEGTYESLTISVYADGLRLGERRSGMLCPYCHGGGTKERTFSMISYATGVQWRCWRNSCGKRGRMNLNTQMFYEGEPTDALDAYLKYEENKVKASGYVEMSEEWKKELSNKYGIMGAFAIAKGWLSNTDGQLVIPMRACHQAVVGHEYRTLNGQPKSRMSLNSLKFFPRNAFETRKDSESVVIVEDSISALKVSQVCRAYSLQGSKLTDMHVEELRNEWRAKYYLLALDKDATDKAADAVQRNKFLLDIRLCPLTKDLKYYYVSDITKLVESYK